MAYFQNPFQSEFRGSWVLGDRQYSLTFVCPANTGRSHELIAAWGEPTSFSGNPVYYNLSGNDSDGNDRSILKIRMTIDPTSKNWVNLSINLTENTYALLDPSPNASQIEPWQIVSILNANPDFSSYFTAALQTNPSSTANTKIAIRQKYDAVRMKFFVLNGQAETVLKFNARAGVAQLPDYFAKCKIWGGDMTDTSDETYSLVLLEPSNSYGNLEVDNDIIDNATDPKGNSLGFDSNTFKPDWELLAGRGSGIYTFKKQTVDQHDRISEIIEYGTGASPGELCRKTNYTYTGSNKNPDKITQIPYVLQASDLVNPIPNVEDYVLTAYGLYTFQDWSDPIQNLTIYGKAKVEDGDFFDLGNAPSFLEHEEYNFAGNTTPNATIGQTITFGLRYGDGFSYGEWNYQSLTLTRVQILAGIAPVDPNVFNNAVTGSAEYTPQFLGIGNNMTTDAPMDIIELDFGTEAPDGNYDFTKCKNLSYLDLSNALGGPTSVNLSNLTNIEYINCSSPQLSSINLTNTTGINECQLNYTNLTTVAFESPNVNNLTISNNANLTSIYANGVTGIASQKVVYIYINDNNLDEIALNNFFESLGVRATLVGGINISNNPGTSTCNVTIATNKNWDIL